MYHVKVQQHISYNMLPTSRAVKKKLSTSLSLFCFCVYRRDCKRDASALLTDLTQQNTGKSSLLPYPALPADLQTPSAEIRNCFWGIVLLFFCTSTLRKMGCNMWRAKAERLVVISLSHLGTSEAGQYGRSGSGLTGTGSRYYLKVQTLV